MRFWKSVRGDDSKKDKKARLRKERLLYRSDFSAASDMWEEGERREGFVRLFRKGGYYHIAINRPSCTYYCIPNMIVSDFKVLVDYRFIKGDGEGVSCGVLFRLEESKTMFSCYEFFISKLGYSALDLYLYGEYGRLENVSFHEFIKQNSAVNCLMVQMVDEEICVGVNGQFRMKVSNRALTKGKIGLTATTFAYDSVVEVAFRDFRLYALE